MMPSIESPRRRDLLALAGLVLPWPPAVTAARAAAPSVFETVQVGDGVYALFAERLLGILQGLALQWIAALERLRDELRPETVVSSHGRPGPADKALADSLGYLLMLRDGARRLFDAGAFDPVEVAEKLDQSKFAYLRNYDDTRFRSENAIRMAEEVLKSRE